MPVHAVPEPMRQTEQRQAAGGLCCVHWQWGTKPRGRLNLLWGTGGIEF